jgi:hypothetical protein
MLAELLANLSGAWRSHLHQAGLETRQPLTALQVAGGRGRNRKVKFLIFSGRARNPLLVVKVARSAEYRHRLRHEFQALSQVWSRPVLRPSVAQPLGLFELDRTLVMVERAVPGVSLGVLLRRQRRTRASQVRVDLDRAGRWLRALQQETAAGTCPFPGRLIVEAHRRRLEQVSGSWKLPAGFVGQLLDLADHFEGCPLPRCGQHGDYWPGNVLLAGEGLGVIDWEDYRPEASPFTDLFQFTITYAQTYPARGWRWPAKAAAFHRAFLEKNWFSSLVGQTIQDYFRAARLPDELVPLCLSLFLMRRALPGRKDSLEPWREILAIYAEHLAVPLSYRAIARNP